MASSSGGGGGGVPPGFRFHPTDEELLHYYLKKKVSFEKFEMEVIREVDLNKMEPWELQERCKIGSTPQNEWYFFSHKDRKYPTGSRTNRATSAGFWKATGRDKCIRNTFKKIGMRKTLVFYRGRAPHGQKTDWIMHEVFKKKNLFRVGSEGGGGGSSTSHSNSATTTNSNQLLGLDGINGQSQSSLMMMHHRIQTTSGASVSHHHQQQHHNYLYMKPELGLHNFSSQFQMPLLGVASTSHDHSHQYLHQTAEAADQAAATSMEPYDFSRLQTQHQSPIMLKQLMTSSNSNDQQSLNEQCVMIDRFVQPPHPQNHQEEDDGETTANGENSISQMTATGHQQQQHSLHSEMDFWGYTK
ncbi:hypothetical protein V2J09_013829 [Rumex salicifolius]